MNKGKMCSGLDWYWAYFPYLDPPEEQKESALRAGYIKVVSKVAADKVIADLEESHKKEVGQLLMEIVELKGQVNGLKNRSNLWHYNAVEEHKKVAEKDKELRHQKYKRCLAMAKWCDSEMNYWYDRIKTEQCQRFKFYDKWHKRWLELAEKFKEAK